MVQRKFKLKIKQVIKPICDLRLKPELNSNLETQLLFGEKIKIINENEKQWVLCQSIEDDYTGYIKKNNLGDLKNTNYKITNLSCFIYRLPNIKSGVVSKLFLNSKISATKNETDWLSFFFKDKKYYIHHKDVNLINQYPNSSWVDLCIKFLNTPYLWGGKSHLGLDCSALVQLAIQSVNKRFPRNTDEQFKSNILKNVSERELDKGTLIFWKGHVAIAINKTEIIHANAYHMQVAIESLREAKKRIEPLYGQIIGYKKLIKEN